MRTEYECRILDVDVDEIQKKLEKIGAKLVKERSMRRYVYDIEPKREGFWMRLRDNGEKTTLTVKEKVSDRIDGTREIEITVDSFERTNTLLNRLGFTANAYQENRRISFTYGDVEIEIDFWPKIPPYLEIEADSAGKVEKVVKLLGFRMSDTTSISVPKVYKKYGLDIHKFKELKF
jgi:adenylate cyclase class 2